MLQLKRKGEVFEVLPDGRVVKRISSFREMFEAYEYVREDWEVAWNTQMEAEKKQHQQNKIIRKAQLEASRGTVVIWFAIISALALFSVLG